MNFQINFQKAKRNYMVLTFDDEKEDEGKVIEFVHTIQVGMPKKRVFDAIIRLQEVLEDLADAPEEEFRKSEKTRRQVDELYDMAAVILSNNMLNEKITTDWVTEQLTLEEIKIFIQQYVKFCNGEAANPN